MTAEEVQAIGLRKNMCALQDTCLSASTKFPAEILAIALAEQSLHLEHQVTYPKQARVEVNLKLQLASSAVLSAQHSALANAEEGVEGRGELGTKEQLGVA